MKLSEAALTHRMPYSDSLCNIDEVLYKGIVMISLILGFRMGVGWGDFARNHHCTIRH